MCANFWTVASALVQLCILSTLNIEYLVKKCVIWSTRCWSNESTLQHVALKNMFYENVAWQPKCFDSPPLPRSNTVWKVVVVVFVFFCLFVYFWTASHVEKRAGSWRLSWDTPTCSAQLPKPSWRSSDYTQHICSEWDRDTAVYHYTTQHKQAVYGCHIHV